eukprot:TRINITY_DN14500_c0_g1_i4.p2 TRINITY_DN14500_c0_g1~~TRINITY_DN14500_c0_g1_i4.p2  ORF type:complete len:364 (-),score=67.04 TRINITY_DN14500_c0_g1_i4:371-1462(-)
MPRETWRPRSHVLVNFGTTSILWHHHVLLAHVGNAEWIVADTDRKLTVLKLESPPLLGIVDYNRSQAELPVGIIRAESIMEDESTKGIFETKELLRLCQRAEERVPYERARLGYVDLKIGHFRALGANKKEQIHFGDALVVTPSDQEFGRHCTVQVGEYGATMAGEYVEDVQFDKWLYNHVPLSDDVRVLPVAFDTMGQRYCKMETSSARQTTDKFKDWPLEGDRFAQAHCRLVYLKHRTYANFHENWARSLLYDDPANDDVPEHKILCSAMHDFVTYDQLNIGNLAGVERIVKRLMEIEGMEGEYEREVRLGWSRNSSCGWRNRSRSICAASFARWRRRRRNPREPDVGAVRGVRAQGHGPE